ncbi:MAG TPA: hypothetical protein VMZ53_29305 [Kofleriaceae bacterium]|nr:hypothetical protein [Kofleriaceae bacterium]
MRAAVLAVALLACKYDGEFPCTQTDECRTADNAGNCEQAGWCSLHDDTCDSGRRFDETAGDGLAKKCVAGPQGCEDWHPHFFKPCGLPAPSGNLTFNGYYKYDTTDGTLTDLVTMATIPQPSVVIDGVRFLSVQDVTASSASSIALVGNKPLVIAAWGSMVINGLIDASSQGDAGPGANPNGGCNAPTLGADATATTPGGGGGGAALQGNGGNGGGGAAGATKESMPMTIRGGCRGGNSGAAGPGAVSPATADTHARGGMGGGALVLSSRLSLTIDGSVTAGGEGGGGSPMGAGCGGAGGGAGGMIVLEGSAIELHGTVFATGGGGGGVATKSGQGMKGRDGSLTGAAGGAAPTGCTGAGGAGSTAATLDGGNGGTGACGGAGGGGGSGWILVFTQSLDMVGAMTAPMPSTNPF